MNNDQLQAVYNRVLSHGSDAFNGMTMDEVYQLADWVNGYILFTAENNFHKPNLTELLKPMEYVKSLLPVPGLPEDISLKEIARLSACLVLLRLITPGESKMSQQCRIAFKVMNLDPPSRKQEFYFAERMKEGQNVRFQEEIARYMPFIRGKFGTENMARIIVKSANGL